MSNLDLFKIAEGANRSLAVEVDRSQKILAMVEDICRPLRTTNKQLERLSYQIAEMARVRDCDTDRLRESIERLCRPMPEMFISETILKIAGRDS